MSTIEQNDAEAPPPHESEAAAPRPYMKEIGEAVALIHAPGFPGGKPITVIGTKIIRDAFDAKALEQAINTRRGPGVTDLVLNPDAHAGYGAPIGCVLVSPSHIYPGPVGVDIKCSMSLLQMDVPEDAIADRKVRRALIDAICERTPTGRARTVKKSRRVPKEVARRAVIEGASAEVCEAYGIPPHWAERCEDAFHRAHDGTAESLAARLAYLEENDLMRNLGEKLTAIGSYGGGNHFGEANIVHIEPNDEARFAAHTFGLRDKHVAFLSHCGSRGFGNVLAQNQFKALQAFFDKWAIPYPGDDKELVYAPLGTPEANAYIDDMSLGANFASVNHLLINQLVLEAFQEVLPGAKGELVYFISHNIARVEYIDGKKVWVHRKGATRAYPAGHFSLTGTPFAETGHPILLPGNPKDGSAIMVAGENAAQACFSVNHGAGRAMGRKAAMRALNQAEVDKNSTNWTSSATRGSTPSTRLPPPTRTSPKCSAPWSSRRRRRRSRC